MLAKNAESSLAGLGCRLIRQPINSETEFAKARQGPADEFIVRDPAWQAMSHFKENGCTSASQEQNIRFGRTISLSKVSEIVGIPVKF